VKITGLKFEQDIFKYVDRIKDLLSPEIWQNVLLDCSKNELFILWLLFRNKEVNMTQIAEYIHVPLNTATGIVGRMEKKNLICRERSQEDKRIVTIQMGERGGQQMQTVVSEFMYYGEKVVSAFSEEELNLIFRMMDKLTDIMKDERTKKNQNKKIKKISIE